MPQSKLDILVKNQLTLTQENPKNRKTRGSAHKGTETHLKRASHCCTDRNAGTEPLPAGQLPSAAPERAREILRDFFFLSILGDWEKMILKFLHKSA